jgi:formate dehydrogenase iron-sulfur subunit
VTTNTTSIRLPVIDSQAVSEGRGKESLLTRLLREQSDLSAVERFSQFHDSCDTPLQEKYYRNLIPASPPGPDQQYAFEVDLDKCSGCKACVTACHSLNGLEDGETWRSVGLLHGGEPEAPVQKTVTTACHHCLEPACMAGCPVKAYDKDPDTGIVKHLDDQCIGCQYCIFTCPYEVPQYSVSRGIVRKCDMCSDRLSAGEAPACVQSCPNGAIAINVVERASALEAAQADAFLPGAPAPSLTAPTTSYKNKSALPKNMLPADFYSVRPAHQHMPLVWMLVLTQLSVGALALERFLDWLGGDALLDPARPYYAFIALALGLIAIGASTMHLGRPLYAWRAFLGLRTSWLSREIIAFGVFAKLAALYAAAAWLAAPRPGIPERLSALSFDWGPSLGDAAAAVGLFAVFCSAMIYHVTRRQWWHLVRSGFKFLMTALVLGVSGMILMQWAVGMSMPGGVSDLLVEKIQLAGLILMAIAAFKLAGESLVFLSLRDKKHGDLKRSALLLRGDLARLTFFRYALGAVGGVLVPLFLIATASAESPSATMAGAVIAFVALLGGELVERMLFFGAMSSARMPGGMP